MKENAAWSRTELQNNTQNGLIGMKKKLDLSSLNGDTRRDVSAPTEWELSGNVFT